MTLLIGLAGYAGSGKDAAAQALVEDGWERRAFADTLRDFLYRLNPSIINSYGSVSLQHLVDKWGWDYTKNNYHEVRRLLQRVGTDCGRELIGENVWVDATFRPEMTKNVVVTDVRFPNEVQAIRDRGGVVIRVERDGVLPPVQADGTVHASETALGGVMYDAFIQNNHSVADLHALIREWAAYYERKARWMKPDRDLGVCNGFAR